MTQPHGAGWLHPAAGYTAMVLSPTPSLPVSHAFPMLLLPAQPRNAAALGEDGDRGEKGEAGGGDGSPRLPKTQDALEQAELPD